MDIIEAQVTSQVVIPTNTPNVVGTVRNAWNSREIGADKQFHYPILNDLDLSIELTLKNAGINLEEKSIEPIKNDIEGKAAKEFRANLRKVIDALKKESTAEKNKILEEYNDFESRLKVTLGKLDISDEVLKKAIDEYTQEGYKALDKELEAYWNELTSVAGIDFYPYSKLGIKVMSSTSKNKEINKMTEIIESVNFQKELLYQTSPIADRVWQEFTNQESVGYLDLKQSVAEVNRRIEIARQEQAVVEAMKAAQEEVATPVAEPTAPTPTVTAPAAPTVSVGKPMKAPVKAVLTLTGSAEQVNLAIEMVKTLNLIVEVDQKSQESVGSSLF